MQTAFILWEFALDNIRMLSWKNDFGVFPNFKLSIPTRTNG
jgi:hypothetical protein